MSGPASPRFSAAAAAARDAGAGVAPSARAPDATLSIGNENTTGAAPAGAGGTPDPRIVEQAARWMARLWSGTASAADLAACRQWRVADPAHEEAWRQLESINGKFASVPADIARHALREPAVKARVTRRRVLGVTGLAGLLAGAHALRGNTVWRAAWSDYATRTGEIRRVVLPDGTTVVLDSASAIDAAYDAGQRLVRLHAGRVLVATAHESRPLRVRCAHGDVQALGTRFSMQAGADSTRVAVFEGAVSVRPASESAGPVRLDAGWQADYTRAAVLTPQAAVESTAWANGLLAATDMRLAEFAQIISRYRAGMVRCDPAVAGLRVSGVFSLRDTGRALHSVSLSLPVSVHYRTAYWVTIAPR